MRIKFSPLVNPHQRNPKDAGEGQYLYENGEKAGDRRSEVNGILENIILD